MRGRLLSSAIYAAALYPLAGVAQAAVKPLAAVTTAPSLADGLLQVLLGLIVVLCLMAALAWALRRFHGTKGPGNAAIRIVGGVSVGNREHVVIVEVADQWIVVGVAPGRINALATMYRQEQQQPATATPDVSPAKNFSNWLAQTLDKHNGQ